MLKKQRAFFQILLSYLVIMLTPLLVLGGLVFNFFYNTYSKDLVETRMSDLSTFHRTMDNFINVMNANAYTAFHSRTFTNKYLEESYGNFLDVCSHLGGISFTNDFIDNAFFLNQEQRRIYTTQTMYDYVDFEEFNQGYGVPPEALEELLLSNNRSYWLPMQGVGENNEEMVSYVVTNKNGSNPGNASLFFHIRKNLLDGISGLNTESSGILIVNAANEVIYSSNPKLDPTSWEAWKGSEERRSDEAVILDVEGTQYLFIQKSSLQSPITYISITHYQEIMDSILSQQKIFYIGILITALVGAFFISFFMKINYTPIRAIIKLTGNLFRENGRDGQTGNELESARRALVKINERHTVMMHEKITLKLMRGGYKALKELESDAGQYGYVLTGPLFRVVVFRVDGSQRALDQEQYGEIAGLIENSLRVYNDATTVNYSEMQTIFLVISGLAEELKGLSSKYIQIKNLIENTYPITLSVGVGEIGGVDEVMNSVTQATAASNYNFVKGKGSVTFYSELKDGQRPKRLEYPSRALDALYNAILAGDSARVKFDMKTLVKHISDTKSFFYGTCLAYDILNTAMKAMRDLNYDGTAFADIPISREGALHSIDEIVDIVNYITAKIVDIISENRDDFPTGEVYVPMTQFEQVMQYIGEHYYEETFSAKSLAARFDMSVSNLSHFFKKHTSQNVSEYIALLRFKRAKELLATTDLNLQEIATSCGYLHLSTFMRQFKQREGCTPSIYRTHSVKVSSFGDAAMPE